ncbi:hypothetical protein [Marinigracilibium pacificum]|uniref:Uncharacterized protein n=1 Tax=Marinigracilibium pacificum TaxID=2729599 RepID=A0A848J7G5_9BACT|nr:hypothetical protein [Marinigracilibium pacificum]NMM50339.1 hypothetical protein [Marinigracilibium pacificum]
MVKKSSLISEAEFKPYLKSLLKKYGNVGLVFRKLEGTGYTIIVYQKAEDGIYKEGEKRSLDFHNFLVKNRFLMGVLFNQATSIMDLLKADDGEFVLQYEDQYIIVQENNEFKVVNAI